MRHHPALDLTWPATPAEADVERLLAEVDDEGPTALDGHGPHRRIFFAEADARDRAADRVAIAAPTVDVQAVDVPGDDWAERSQAALRPVTIGRFVIAPPWHAAEARRDATATVIVIRPSMGFGTGHHASTRLCLRLLQTVAVEGRSVIDIGTGSGVLALAAWRLRAAHVDGIDRDQDALDSARGNLIENGAAGAIRLRRDDLRALPSSRYDVILANLTADLLGRHAAKLAGLARPNAHLVASGFEDADAEAVGTTLTDVGWTLVSEADEEGWRGAVFGRPTSSTASRAS
jgi:ribosomal protein L11 methyltransferase